MAPQPNGLRLLFAALLLFPGQQVEAVFEYYT